MIYNVRGINFRYSKAPVLQDLSFQIGAGEFVTLLGPNGAGKSTLLKVLAGLLPDRDGAVEFMGRPLSSYDASELARRLAFVPQETHMIFPFTAGEVVLMGRLPYRKHWLIDAPGDSKHAARAMAWTDSLHLADQMFSELSGGERQRVVLASALAQAPKVLLLDEPTVFLDLRHQLQFYGILERLNREEGMTIVAVTHDVNLAAQYARRMIGMRAGRIVADGPPLSILTPEKLYEVFEVHADVVDRPQGGKYVIPIV